MRRFLTSISEWPVWKVNEMDELYSRRRRDYLNQVFKYLRYVLNDFFVLSVLFALGGLGLSYSDYIRGLRQSGSPWYAAPLCIAVIVAILQFGRLGTLLKRADAVFLLAREEGMPGYLRRGLASSFAFGAVVVVCAGVVLVPFMMFACGLTKIDIVLVISAMVLFRLFMLLIEAAGMYDERFTQPVVRLCLRLLLPAASLSLAFLANAVPAPVIAAAAVIILARRLGKLEQSCLFRWNYAIEREADRMMGLYRFFNLFCDVPYVSVKARRRRFLDRFLPGPDGSHPYRYLYVRGMVRSGEYSSLAVRLTVLGCLVLLFLDTWLAPAMAALFLYMLGFQMIPLASGYDEIVFMHIYPAGLNQRFSDFRSVLRTLMLAVTCIFTVFCLIGTKSPVMALAAFSAMVLVTLVLTGGYLRRRIEKQLDMTGGN